MRARRPTLATGAGSLPLDIAAGPDADAWDPGERAGWWPRYAWAADVGEHARRSKARTAWLAAGRAWSLAHGLGPSRWRQILPSDVAYAESALGRAESAAR